MVLLLLLLDLAVVQCYLSQATGQAYLNKYGFYAVQDFQEFSSLESTGELDLQTENQMRMPRCGNRDRGTEQNKDIQAETYTYRLENFPTSSFLSEQEVRKVFGDAAAEWRKAGRIFLETEEKRCDINVLFCDLSACAKSNYTQMEEELYALEGGELATTKFVGKDQIWILIDDRRFWGGESSLSRLGYANLNLQTQLLQIAVHEFGHVLGLPHSNRKSSIMNPFYSDWVASVSPSEDDIERLSRHPKSINFN